MSTAGVGVRGTRTGGRTSARVVIGAGVPAGFVGHFRRLGWEVLSAATGREARELAVRHAPSTVVLAVESPCESGLLTCAKLVGEMPGTRVVMVGPDDDTVRRFARFAGACDYVVLGEPADDLTAAVAG